MLNTKLHIEVYQVGQSDVSLIVDKYRMRYIAQCVTLGRVFDRANVKNSEQETYDARIEAALSSCI